MFCTKCGRPNRDDANYCAYCGANVGQLQPSPTAAPQPGIGRTLWIAGIAALVIFLGMVISVAVCAWALHQESLGGDYVVVDGRTLVGADGDPIRLTQNPDATDPSWAELRQFLYSDHTDSIPYDDDTFVCADFAEALHNNAEEAGIKSGYVVIRFVGETDGHACNVFHTTDRGTVYIDVTGTEDGSLNVDKTVDLAVGEYYCPVSIFANRGHEYEWECLGELSEFEVTW
ncbi:MAG: zinc ribbon domain-containing protein [Dehalococcoidia bacterium]|nr:zinc ribbon domain-containing protein [Dehalococcoidia bacterium]